MNEPPFATGFGYDVHRLVPGRRCVLGGVDIPFDRGLDGHSDADVLLHAVMDALLGAAAQGDIGTHFPPSDERWRGADSRDLLRSVHGIVSQSGWRIANIDCTVVAEAPRIAPHTGSMRANIAADTGISAARVSVKATTNETMGFVGRGEGIAAMATVLLYRPQASLLS